ncbi:MAG TPA: hypothetical protein VNC50_06985 [Planctomycetia bacterium]|nr:hypothetical protein [Planctomycetia bacterium]
MQFGLTSIGLGIAACLAFAGEDCLKPGDGVGPYHVLDVTGPKAGEKLCYRCQFGNKPVVNVFARTTDENLAGLLTKIDAKLGEDEKLRGFVTVLTENTDGAVADLKTYAKKHEIKKLPLTVFEGKAGPDTYKIDKNADVTVMLWVGGKIKAVHTFEAGKLDSKGVDAVLADLPKISS